MVASTAEDTGHLEAGAAITEYHELQTVTDRSLMPHSFGARSLESQYQQSRILCGTVREGFVCHCSP